MKQRSLRSLSKPASTASGPQFLNLEGSIRRTPSHEPEIRRESFVSHGLRILPATVAPKRELCLRLTVLDCLCPN